MIMLSSTQSRLLTLAGLIAMVAMMPDSLFATVARWGVAAYAFALAISAILPPWNFSPPPPLTPTPTSYALITGCTRGLGELASRSLAARGWNLLLIARDRKRVFDLSAELKRKHPNIRVDVIVQDLSVPDAASKIGQAMDQLGFVVADGESQTFDLDQSDRRPTKYIDILLNNAGHASVDMFHSTRLSTLESQVHCMCTVPVGLTRLLLPSMIARARGRIVNVASLVGYIPSPRAAVYGATKSFLVSLTDSIAYEISIAMAARARTLEKDAPAPNLQVVLVAPGPTHTGFAASAECDESLIFRMPLITQTGEQVANEMVEGIIEGRRFIQTGFLVRLTRWLAPKLPSKLSHFTSFVLWGGGHIKRDFFGQGTLKQE